MPKDRYNVKKNVNNEGTVPGFRLKVKENKKNLRPDTHAQAGI